jgi:hypothetical protein
MPKEHFIYGFTLNGVYNKFPAPIKITASQYNDLNKNNLLVDKAIAEKGGEFMADKKSSKKDDKKKPVAKKTNKKK